MTLISLQKEVESFMETIVSSLPATADHLNAYWQAQAEDPECSKLSTYCKSGWSTKHTIKGNSGFRSLIVVPNKLRKETLNKIHKWLSRYTCSRLRIQESVWWPGVSKEVEQFVKAYSVCQKMTPPSKEPTRNCLVIHGER